MRNYTGPAIGGGCAVIIFIPIIILFALFTAFIAGWCAVPFKVFSADNVQDQWQFAYTYDESLSAIARQGCAVERLELEAATETERSQRRTQLLAIQQNYARVAGEYNARLRNAFEARLVRPPDVPEIAPSYESKTVGCHQGGR